MVNFIFTQQEIYLLCELLLQYKNEYENRLKMSEMYPAYAAANPYLFNDYQKIIDLLNKFGYDFIG